MAHRSESKQFLIYIFVIRNYYPQVCYLTQNEETASEYFLNGATLVFVTSLKKTFRQSDIKIITVTLYIANKGV